MTTDSPVSIIYKRLEQTFSTLGIQSHLRTLPVDPRSITDGTVHVVVMQAQDGWGRSNLHTDLRPVVRILIYANATTTGSTTVEDGEAKAIQAFKAIDKVLDYAPADASLISCRRIGSFSIYPIEDSSSAVMLAADYRLQL